MRSDKIIIDRNLLYHLYIEKKLNPYQIGDLLGCNFATIRHRIIEYNIPLRSPAEARTHSRRDPFTGSLAEKAYIYGFTVGDLNVYIPGKITSTTLIVRCHTTQQAQVDVFDSCFATYSAITKSFNRQTGSIHMTAYLDVQSFKFLMDKYTLLIPNWLTSESAWPFIAGYNDAEGNFLLNQNRARFKIDCYDGYVLQWINHFLKSININSKLRLIGRKEDLRSNGTHFNHDLWRLNINDAHSLKCFIEATLPYTRHSKRRSDMVLCLGNIKSRILKGSV